jgi:lipopolysaccharide transport system ATP-binding protein
MAAPDVALEMDRVYKRFRKGELHDSLRDLVPALAGRLLRRGTRTGAALGRQEFWALRDVSFAVQRGAAFGIIGSNGAGKSTILKVLSRILRPTTGEMRVHGRLSALIEVSAGFHPDLTGRENIYLNGTILGMRRHEIRARFDDIVAFSGLEEFIDTPVKRYSSGMFARLGFSVAAHINPDVLLVDEVLSVGDFAFQQRCMDRMRQIVRSGATVIFVSHNLRAVSELCDQALLLDHGSVAAIGPAREVVGRYLQSVGPERGPAPDAACAITGVTIGGTEVPGSSVVSGAALRLEVRFVARRRVREVAVVMQVLNEDLLGVFDTSTERLGLDSVTLEAGQAGQAEFDLTAHLAPGTYHVAVWLHHYPTQTSLDHWANAATFFVSSDQDVRGVAHLYPRCRLRIPTQLT